MSDDIAVLKTRIARLEQEIARTLIAFDEGSGVPEAIHRLRKAAGRSSWDQHVILKKAKEWQETYGEPPKAVDWNPAAARRQGQDPERFYLGDWPPYRSVQHRFGSWNAMMQAAGFEPRTGPDEPRGPDPSASAERWPVWTGWEYMRHLRSRIGTTQVQVAHAARITPIFYGQVENGHYGNPGIRVVLSIARALAVSPAALAVSEPDDDEEERDEG